MNAPLPFPVILVIYLAIDLCLYSNVCKVPVLYYLSMTSDVSPDAFLNPDFYQIYVHSLKREIFPGWVAIVDASIN